MSVDLFFTMSQESRDTSRVFYMIVLHAGVPRPDNYRLKEVHAQHRVTWGKYNS